MDTEVYYREVVIGDPRFKAPDALQLMKNGNMAGLLWTMSLGVEAGETRVRSQIRR